MAPEKAMVETRSKFAWIDLLWVVFLAGLAVLPPIREIHKQLILAGIGLFQIFESRFLKPVPAVLRNSTSILVKIILAALLVGHTEGINSSYYPIYYLPVVSAAMLFDAWATLLWTALASASYCAFLIPALKTYQLTWTPEGAAELAFRNLFFFLAAIVVNRFVTESRRQALRYQNLAETLAETNRQLERVQADARRSERLAALGQLSAGLAHEIRNPLAVIKGSAETLNKKLVSAEPLASELAGYISSEVNRLNALVSRFLDFARPSEPEFRPEEIPPLIERALKAARERWPETKVEVESDYAEHLPRVLVDAAMCEQVFANLALNAYEAMSEQGGKLKVSAKAVHGRAEEEERRPGVIIEFQDTGPGVPTGLREHIFNPFFTTKKTGVGLGLSIVSKIIDDHRGWIAIANGADRGACFRLFLPAAEAQQGNGISD
jgi:signal transduction histidine kinase